MLRYVKPTKLHSRRIRKLEFLGRGYVERLQRWKAEGYRVETVYLKLPTVELALKRVANRVKQGGHNVPEADVRRRFLRGWRNFGAAYRALADGWSVYDNDGQLPVLIEESNA